MKCATGTCTRPATTVITLASGRKLAYCTECQRRTKAPAMERQAKRRGSKAVEVTVSMYETR